MRNLYTLLLFLSAIVSFAQIPNCNTPVPYNKRAYEILENLDKSQISTGVLYENVFPWAEVEFFDGTTNADTSNTLHFMQAYTELYNSTYNRANILHPYDYENACLNVHTDRDLHHPLGIIDYDFNTIDPNSVTNNLLYVNNQKLYDVAGRTQSPYFQKHVFLASPVMTGDFERFYRTTHYFHVEQQFILSNTGLNVSDIDYIDFEMNGSLNHREYVNGRSSFVIPVDFSIIDKIFETLIIRIKKAVGDGQISRIQLSTEVLQNLTPCSGQTQILVTGDPFDGGYGTGAYSALGRGYVFFADNNCSSQQIRKPIIFVDGYDPTNTRDVWQIWDKRINKPFTEGSNTNVRFGNELRANGYDVIIYDYDEKFALSTPNRGGAGLVENNGIAFAKFLQTLYQQYQGSLEQGFIIISPSMGSLVARYGLTYMEHNNIPHHTALYISFDGPHQGAQVPIGVQNMLDLVTQYGGLRLSGGIRNFLHQNSAAKQMLVHHSSTEAESVTPHNFRNTFLSNLASIGNFPVQCRTVAIANGNREGILKSSHPTIPISGCGDEFELAVKRRLLPNCTAPYCYKMRTQVFAQTDNSRCESMQFKVNNNANLLEMVFGGGQFSEKTTYTLPSFDNNSYDIAPGGVFGADAEMDIDTLKFLQWILTGKVVLNNKLMNTNFVPTVSSVAYTFPNEPYKIYKNLSGIPLSSCAGTTPFDTAYAPSSDIAHAQYDGQLISWFRDEIYNLKGKSVCSSNCPEYLNLTNNLPSGTTATYQASKAICLLPNFTANSGTTITAKIGCPPLLMSEPPPKKVVGINSVTSCDESFNWDSPNRTCEGSNTKFFAYVKNIDINTYAEFSIDGTTWHKANILDNGFTITLPTQTGSQQFFARSADNRGNVIGGYIAYCN